MAAGCNGCHGGGGGGGMGPPLTNPVWIYGKDDDTLFRLVALGSDGLKAQGYTRKGSESVVGPMPAMGEIVKTDDDMWKIIAWIRSVNLSDSASAEGVAACAVAGLDRGAAGVSNRSMRDRIEIVEGDITTQDVDAIVNAANTAARRRGRLTAPSIAPRAPSCGGVPQARRLPHRRGEHHARLPACRRATSSTPSARCGAAARAARTACSQVLRNSLALAVEHGPPSIAFPSISTGIYGFPRSRRAHRRRHRARALPDYPSIDRWCSAASARSRGPTTKPRLPRHSTKAGRCDRANHRLVPQRSPSFRPSCTERSC